MASLLILTSDRDLTADFLISELWTEVCRTSVSTRRKWPPLNVGSISIRRAQDDAFPSVRGSSNSATSAPSGTGARSIPFRRRRCLSANGSSPQVNCATFSRGLCSIRRLRGSTRSTVSCSPSTRFISCELRAHIRIRRSVHSCFEQHRGASRVRHRFQRNLQADLSRAVRRRSGTVFGLYAARQS